jgi:hypothetical protein
LQPGVVSHIFEYNLNRSAAKMSLRAKRSSLKALKGRFAGFQPPCSDILEDFTVERISIFCKCIIVQMERCPGQSPRDRKNAR